MTQRRALCLLLAGCMVFGAIIFAEFDPTHHPEAARTAVAEGPGLDSMPRQDGPQLDELVTTILARPLFDQTRRAPQPFESDDSTDRALTDARLTGIVTEPSQRLAIFALTSARPLALTEGQTVSGWQIDSITPEEVSLTGPSGTKILRPNADSAVALSATPAAAPQLPSFPPIPATAAQPRRALLRPVLPAQRTRDQE